MAFIINPYAFGASYDPDAQAFFTAAGITDNTQKTAVNQLVVDLKTDGLWTKMKAVYPFVGGTASSHKYNLKNPLDTDAAFRLVFSGGWTHSSTGADPNGTNAYADTKLTPSSSLTQDNTHLSYYSRENVSGAFIDMGTRGTSDFSLYNYVGTYYSDQYNGTSGRASSANSNTSGFITGSRTTSAFHKVFRNGNQIGSTNTGAPGSISGSNSVFIAALNYSPIQYYSSREYAFASIGDGLNATQVTNLYTRVQAFQTTLGRNV